MIEQKATGNTRCDFHLFPCQTPIWRKGSIMQQNKKFTSEDTRRLCAISIFVAMAFVSVLFFRIKVVFLTFDFKDAILGVCALVYGPGAGAIAATTVALIEMTISDTDFYGFVMNALSSIAFITPAAIVYNKKRTLKRAGIGIPLGVVTMAVVMVLANMVVTPLFVKEWDISDVLAIIPTLILPFNLTKGITNAALLFFIYNPVTNAMKRAKLIPKRVNDSKTPALKNENSEEKLQDKKPQTRIVLIVSLAVLVAALACFFFVLGGEADFFTFLQSSSDPQ